MEYITHHVSLLIDILLVRYNVNQEKQVIRDRAGLVQLQEEIEFDIDKESDRSEKQYLYKLSDRLTKAIQLKEEFITVKEVFVQNCISYLQYDSFKGFEGRINFIQKRLQEAVKDNSQILFLLPEERKNRIIGDVESAQKPDQDLQFIRQTYNINVNSWDELLSIKKEKRLTIWLIQYELFQNSEEELISFLFRHKNQLTHVLPFFLCSKDQELEALKAELQEESLIGFDGDLAILIQLLIYNQSIRKQVQEEKEASKQKDSIIIHTGGGIGIGKIKTKKFNQTTNNITNYNS